MSISSLYQQNLDDAARGALLTVVAQNPSTTVTQLRELLGQYPNLGEMTLGELVGGGSKTSGAKQGKKSSAVAAKPVNAAAAKPAAAAPAPAVKRGKPQEEWNTRTNEGRAMMDRAVLEAIVALGSVAVSSEMVRARIGGTPAQIRESLNRHIEAGDVSFSGKARGTRYTLET